jgi:hypothetical protein
MIAEGKAEKRRAMQAEIPALQTYVSFAQGNNP